MPQTTLSLPMLAAGNPLDHVVDHPIIKSESGWYLLTNHMIMMSIAALLMLLIFPMITRRYRSGELVPTGTRNFFEALLLFVRNDVAKPVLAEHTDRYMPFLWTAFFFILFNLVGVLVFRDSPIAYAAHAGGFVAGWLMGGWRARRSTKLFR